MKIDLDKKIAALKGTDQYWSSFVEQDNFELGVLYLRPGQEDVQTPHGSDEVYFIVEGDGMFTIGEEEHTITPNSAFVVSKGTPHKIHSNTRPVIGFYALN